MSLRDVFARVGEKNLEAVVDALRQWRGEPAKLDPKLRSILVSAVLDMVEAEEFNAEQQNGGRS